MESPTLHPLRRAREERGISRFALAIELGVTERTITRWESGQGSPSIDQAFAIADSLGVAIDELRSGEAA